MGSVKPRWSQSLEDLVRPSGAARNDTSGCGEDVSGYPVFPGRESEEELDDDAVSLCGVESGCGLSASESMSCSPGG